MTNDAFWDIIAKTKAVSGGENEAQAEALQQELPQQQPNEIVEFERIFGENQDRAYRWDLWGAAYIIGGGCSDDAFIDFRNWLISMGREVYEEALADPDSLAGVEIGPDTEETAFFEEFAYVASQAYEEKAGGEMPYPERDHPADPEGEAWEEEGDELERRFPKLWAKYSGA